MVSVSFYFGGIDLDSFQYCFGTRLEDQFPREIAFALDRGLMEYVHTPQPRLQLTKSGKRHFGGVVVRYTFV